MYHWLYNLGIAFYTAGIRLAAAFNTKARDWTQGRKGIFKHLREELTTHESPIWFHAASLGEAEQGVPIMQAVKQLYPQHKILLTFFSPSGKNHFKKEGLADFIFYLPADSPGNARKFLATVKPVLAFFIKYEIWANYLLELQRQGIPQVIAPAIFRPRQMYFNKPHRHFFLPILRQVNAIMVQDEASFRLLHSESFQNVQVVGDSRYDRVLQNTQSSFKDAYLEAFCSNHTVLIGGSTWPVGENILKSAMERNPRLKLIIAPHNVSEENIKRVHKLFGQKSFRYSQPPGELAAYQVCIIDKMGLLSRLYRYGQLAYIGGAFGHGIHNSLEAAAYGMPLFFGPNHKSFIEPTEMIKAGFAHEISDAGSLLHHLQPILEDEKKRQRQAEIAQEFVKANAGVTEKIIHGINAYLA